LSINRLAEKEKEKLKAKDKDLEYKLFKDLCQKSKEIQ